MIEGRLATQAVPYGLKNPTTQAGSAHQERHPFAGAMVRAPRPR